MSEKVKPIIIKDGDTGNEYTLEFSRDSIVFAEQKGFDINDIEKHPMSRIPELFFYAFRMHHPRMTKKQTDDILYDCIGGMNEAILERLGQLYAAPFTALIPGEDEPKNARMTVEL